MGIVIGIVLTAVFIILDIVFLCSFAFLQRITLVNSLVIALTGGIALYLCNRVYEISLFSSQVHLVICLAVCVILFLLAYFIQKTTIGFWIFAVIFSLLWSFITALTVYILVTKNMVVVWGIFAVSFIINIASHKRSRDCTELRVI